MNLDRLGILALLPLLGCGDGKGDGRSPGATDTARVDTTGTATGPGGTATGTGSTAPTKPEVPCEQPWPITLSERFRSTQFQGEEVIRFLPEPLGGVMFVFHSGGGAVDGVQNIEWYSLYNQLFARNIGVVATNATEDSWDNEELDREANADFPRLRALYQTLVDEGQISAETPVLAAGVSSGGWYSSLFSLFAQEEGWPIAVALHHHAGPEYGLTLPADFVLGENDHRIDASVVRAAYDIHAGDKLLHAHDALVLDPLYFTRHPDFSEDLSRDHFDALVAAGGIDAEGNLLLPKEDLTRFIESYQAGAGPNRALQVGVMLESAWGRHRYHNRSVCDQVAFIEAWVPWWTF